MIIPMRSFFRKDLILFSIHTQLLGLIRDQFPWPFVLHSVCTQGRSLDARLGRDWFQQPLLLRQA